MHHTQHGQAKHRRVGEDESEAVLARKRPSAAEQRLRVRQLHREHGLLCARHVQFAGEYRQRRVTWGVPRQHAALHAFIADVDAPVRDAHVELVAAEVLPSDGYRRSPEGTVRCGGTREAGIGGAHG